MPARHRDRLLGFLWLIDADSPMSDAEVTLAADFASTLALSLLHDALAAGLTAQRELEAVSGVLLGDDPTGAQVLVDEGGFPSLPVTVLVVRPVGAFASDVVEQGLLAARTKLTARHLVRFDHGVLLCAGRVTPAEVHAAFPTPVVVGVGRPARSRTRRRPTPRRCTRRWSRRGCPASAQRRRGLPLACTGCWPPCRPTPDTPASHDCSAEHLPLLETLETYLDLAGSVVETSKALRLHRTSLYYRLQRVEALADTDLKDGNERLMLHLSLKLARLSGRFHEPTVGHHDEVAVAAVAEDRFDVLGAVEGDQPVAGRGLAPPSGAGCSCRRAR